MGFCSDGQPPNNSFKPNLLRCTKHMAERACHVFGSTTQVGLTQALGLSLYPPPDGESRTVKAQVLRFAFELPRTGARLAWRQQGIGAFPLTQAFPKALPASAHPRSATGQVWRCGVVTSHLTLRRGTVRPNNSFKPMPLRGTA